MLVKNFEGSSMSDVMKKIKREFGKNAVILATEEKKVDGSATNFISVRAAVPEDKSIQGASAGESISSQSKDISLWLNKIDKKLDSLGANIVTSRSIQNLENDLRDLKVISTEALKFSTIINLEELNPFLSQLYQHLTLMSLDKQIIDELLNYLKEIPNLSTDTSDSELYKSHAIRWMQKRLKIAQEIESIPNEKSNHIFIGPPSSGKTTCIIKVASRLKANGENNIAFLSYDNLRVGASEQLRIFGKILNIPFYQLNDIDDLPEMGSKLSKHAIVLIDTAGCSSKDQEELANIETLTKGLPNSVSTHLVLSLTEKQVQMDHAIRTFSDLSIGQLIFTKLDLTWTYGEIYNLASRWSIPLSYFSVGQRIPEDLERASRENITERMFRF